MNTEQIFEKAKAELIAAMLEYIKQSFHITEGEIITGGKNYIKVESGELYITETPPFFDNAKELSYDEIASAFIELKHSKALIELKRTKTK